MNFSAGAQECEAAKRELTVTNGSTQPIWIAGGGGALRSVCVVSDTESCLANPSTINPSTGACQCGTDNGALACPSTAQPIGPDTNAGLNCQCASDADCGPTARCNTSVNECYFVLPEPKSPSPFNWKLPPSQSATFCVASASVNWNSTTIPSAVWWSGGIFARTGCKPDGTSCATGDCGAQPRSNCAAGVGGQNPATIAEFTLQRTAPDFYDITLINGANLAERMLPIPAPTATPGAVPKPYWCKVPGALAAPDAAKDCNWNFGKYVKQVPYPSTTSTTDYTTLLLHSSNQCFSSSDCQTGYTCSGSPGACIKTCATDSDCTGTDQPHCLSGGNGNSYCQCDAESDCSGHGYCGTQFIPGIGPNQTYLQQCGAFAGWWTLDDFCANQNDVVGPFNCGAAITDGDGSSSTNLASLAGCTIRGSSSAGNGASCYNTTTYPTTCCGCATDSANILSEYWPPADNQCAGNNNTTWASQIQPFLVNLKRACPTAYSYPYDDPTSTFQCRSDKPINKLGYKVVFRDLVRPPK
ncbi:MAG TPA: thaumatin family protein [Candidatus Binataceae bacterium]